MAVCLAFSRAPLTSPNGCDSPKGVPGVHRLSNPTELLDHRCRKPNPVRGGNLASSGTGRVRKSIPMRARVVPCLLQLATVDLTLRRYDTNGRRSDKHPGCEEACAQRSMSAARLSSEDDNPAA